MVILLSSMHVNEKAKEHLLKVSNGKEAACYYPKIDYTNCNDEKLSLLALEPDSPIQDYNGPVLAGVLQELGLPATVKYIDIYASDLGAKTSLIKLAADMTNCLYEDYQREVAVRIISELNYSNTLLIAPSNSNDYLWQVFGLKYPERPLSLDSLDLNRNKGLLWEGKDLTKWFERPNHTFIPKLLSNPSIRGVQIW